MQVRRSRPPTLKRDDLVALFNTSGYADNALIQRATANRESLGFRVVHAAHYRASRGNAGGMIGERLTDFHALFSRQEVRVLRATAARRG